MPTQKFWLHGLRADQVERVAERARQLDGVLFALASHGDQCAEVEFEDDAITPDEIRKALEELGFTVEIVG